MSYLCHQQIFMLLVSHFSVSAATKIKIGGKYLWRETGTIPKSFNGTTNPYTLPSHYIIIYSCERAQNEIRSLVPDLCGILNCPKMFFHHGFVLLSPKQLYLNRIRHCQDSIHYKMNSFLFLYNFFRVLKSLFFSHRW